MNGKSACWRLERMFFTLFPSFLPGWVGLMPGSGYVVHCARADMYVVRSLTPGAPLRAPEPCNPNAGLAKGKAQLRAGLRMLMWAARHSGAVPLSVPLVKGRGYLFFPQTAAVRPQELLEDGGRLTITVSTL